MNIEKVVVEQPARGGIVATIGPELGQLLVVGLWASTFIVTKAAFAEVSPLAFVFVRFALMTALAFAVLAVRGRTWRVRRSDLPRFLLAGLAGYTFYQLGFVLGLERTSPFASSLLIAMVPLFTMLMLALRGERTQPRGWAGLALALVGVAIFLADQLGRGADGSLIGDLLSSNSICIVAPPCEGRESSVKRQASSITHHASSVKYHASLVTRYSTCILRFPMLFSGPCGAC